MRKFLLGLTIAFGAASASGQTVTAPITVTLPSALTTITDGTNTVLNATKLSVSGGTIGGTSPNATLTITASGCATLTGCPAGAGPIAFGSSLATGSNIGFTGGTLSGITSFAGVGTENGGNIFNLTAGSFTAGLGFISIPAFGEHDIVFKSNTSNTLYYQNTDSNSYTSLCAISHTNVVHGCIFSAEVTEGTVTATIAPTTAVGNSTGTTTLALSSVSGFFHIGDVLTLTGGPATITGQTSGTLGSNGNYTTNISTTLTAGSVVDTVSSVMTVTATSTNLNLGQYASISGGSPTAVTTGTYVFDQSSGTGGGAGTYNLIKSSTIGSPETFTVTVGGQQWGVQCSPTAFGSGNGCYLPPYWAVRQEWNDPAGTGNLVYYPLQIDQFHNMIFDQVNPAGWVPFGVQYSSGSVVFGCAGVNAFSVQSQVQFCQTPTFTKNAIFNGGTSAPSPGGGAGSLGGTAANGLELRGNGNNTNDIALINAGGSIAAYVPRTTTNFGVVGNLTVGGKLIFTGPTPTITSGTATLDSTASNQAGNVTEGTAQTGFTLTFSTTNPFTSTPHCTVTSPNGAAFTSYTPSTTTLIVANLSATGSIFTYICAQ